MAEETGESCLIMGTRYFLLGDFVVPLGNDDNKHTHYTILVFG